MVRLAKLFPESGLNESGRTHCCTSLFTKKMEYQCWTIKDDMLIIPSVYLDWDLDCRLAFVHLVGIVENRIEESNIWNGEELPKERIRLPYYDGIEK